MARSIEASPIQESTQDMLFKQEQRKTMEHLWQEFDFPGQPPRLGSIAEKRLLDCAKNYVDCVTRRRSDTQQTLQERQKDDSWQKKLHTELSIMIIGEPRESLEFSTAERISHFAAEVAYPGFTMDEIGAIQNSRKY